MTDKPPVVLGSGRPKDGYKLADGTEVPSVTEIIGKFKSSGALMHWAWTLGKEGRDPEVEKIAAGRWGHGVHDVMEELLRGDPASVSTIPGTAVKAATEAFYRPEVQALVAGLTHVEVPMVSELHGFGGTFDFASAGSICDWKTGKEIYLDYWIQMGGYYLLCQENNICVDSATIVRVGKAGKSPNFEADGKVEIVRMEQKTLYKCAYAFLNLLNTHKAYNEIRADLKESRKNAKKRTDITKPGIKRTKLSGPKPPKQRGWRTA